MKIMQSFEIPNKKDYRTTELQGHLYSSFDFSLSFWYINEQIKLET